MKFLRVLILFFLIGSILPQQGTSQDSPLLILDLSSFSLFSAISLVTIAFVFIKICLTFLSSISTFSISFLSEDKIKVDFSLEQMFPVKDVDRDYYEYFKEVYGREDNIVFLSLTNDDIFSDNNLSILEMVTDNLRNEVENIDFSFITCQLVLTAPRFLASDLLGS